MDIDGIVRDAVVRRTEQILYRQYETQHLIDVNKAMTQAIEETTKALVSFLAKQN